VEQYKGVPPYYETRAYVARIVKDFNKKKAAQQSMTAKSAAKSGVAKRPGAKTGNPASKVKPSSITQARVSAPPSNE
jgi:hypothetical protein